MPSEYGELCQQLKAEKQARHGNWFDENLTVLRASGVPFELKGTTCLFREDGKPKIDFYPHTGRWRYAATGTPAMRGGATSFLAWYGRQHA